MANPTYFKKDYIEKVRAWVRAGKSLSSFAKKIKHGRNTVYTWRKKYHDFNEACLKTVSRKNRVKVSGKNRD